MATLKETKGRINSVKGTLKITSAMKLVASAKLLSTEKAVHALLPYRDTLTSMLRDLQAALAATKDGISAAFKSVDAADIPSFAAPLARQSGRAPGAKQGDYAPGALSAAVGAPAAPASSLTPRGAVQGVNAPRNVSAATPAAPVMPDQIGHPSGGAHSVISTGAQRSGEISAPGDRASAVAIVAIASNSSLCGAFNANAVKAALECARAQSGEVTVYSIGKKMADAMRRCGFPSPRELNAISSKPDYKVAASLAEELIQAVDTGRFSKVYLIYNHFVNTGHQQVLIEDYISAATSAASVMPDQIGHPSSSAPSVISTGAQRSGEISTPSAQTTEDRGRTASTPYLAGRPLSSGGRDSAEYIIEPSPAEAIDRLLPLTMKVRLFAALLDSNAAEHAARLVAMQTATDNGEDLLHEITLEYNKARQQKITSELLDLASSSV